MSETEKPTGLKLLREPFPPHQISKLPKPSKKQTEELKADYKLGARCKDCGGWHQPDVVHLDYVGHAALTDRLLDADPVWNWEPMSVVDGLPKFDPNGGLWIKLTVCGQTRLGYGHSGEKKGGDAIKETIGDALRNAAMRFGAALDLWHKGDLHGEEEVTKKNENRSSTNNGKPGENSKGTRRESDLGKHGNSNEKNVAPSSVQNKETMGKVSGNSNDGKQGVPNHADIAIAKAFVIPEGNRKGDKLESLTKEEALEYRNECVEWYNTAGQHLSPSAKELVKNINLLYGP